MIGQPQFGHSNRPLRARSGLNLGPNETVSNDEHDRTLLGPDSRWSTRPTSRANSYGVGQNLDLKYAKIHPATPDQQLYTLDVPSRYEGSVT